jgi:4,5-DOPA dioxygenase extradiol
MGQTNKRMPAAFIGHGTPLNALRTNRWTEAWRQLGRELARPRSTLVVSGHWCTDGSAVTAMPRPPTIHELYGFPSELHQFSYPAPGDPKLAARVRMLLEPLPVHLDHSWGLDHGAWSVLSKMFPSADIPVVQLSIDMAQPARRHYEIGQRLRPLRDEGVLVLGSGNVVHNLGGRARHQQQFAHVAGRRPADLIAYETFGADALLAVPPPDHYYPLLYVVGAGGDDEVSIEIDGIERGAISMLSVLYGQKLVQPAPHLMADVLV